MTEAAEALPAVAVGGGLAGGAFAVALARNGRRVMVLERSRGPHHTACGELLNEEAQFALASLGLDPRALGATTITRFRLVQRERQVTTILPFAAAGLSRFRLDEALLATAAHAGAEVVRGTRVTAIELTGDAVAVRTGGRVWPAAVVALATGKYSLRGFARPKGPMVGFKLHLEATSAAAWDLQGTVQLVFFPGGYVGTCLVEDGIMSVAWVLRDYLLRAAGSDWPAQCNHLSRQSSLIGDLLAGARPLFVRPAATAAIPYGFLRTQPIAPSVFPVGDQLAVVPSFTGDGMAIALYSGMAAAQAFIAKQPAATYQSELIRRLRPQFRLASGIGRLLETPVTCAISVAAARLLPSLVTGVVAATRLRGFYDSAAPPGTHRLMAMK